ncbi:MAG: hypothetical protein V3U65_09535 [Granulosicoccaceae bacterium]
MWSAPRNISTAMMRSWENRSDTVVIDEPFYANYLKVTGIDHPMAQEIIDSGDTDWRSVTAAISQPHASGIFFQKHICTHILPHIKLDWVNAISNVFLIRDPHLVVASYAAKREDCVASDLGYALQKNLFDQIQNIGVTKPLVIDSALFIDNPRQQFTILCEQLNIDFEEAMLCWPAGARDTDGVWGKHWYNAVNKSTGFKKQNTAYPALSEAQQQVAEACMADYETIKAYAIRH